MRGMFHHGIESIVASLRQRAGAAIALLTVSLCSSAYADFKSMGDRLPATSNAIIAVNVEKLARFVCTLGW